MKFKIGYLIWDNDDEEWGIIMSEPRNGWFLTSWAYSKDQNLDESDFYENDRFELYEV